MNQAWLIFSAIGAVLLAVTVFHVSLGTVLVFLAVLACPLMMLGMHGGRGHHGEHDAAPRHTHRSR